MGPNSCPYNVLSFPSARLLRSGENENVQNDHYQRKNMRVVISVGGMFHAFNLAEELERRDVFERLYTTYPKYKWQHHDVPSPKVRAIKYPEVIRQIGELPVLERFVPETGKSWLDEYKSKTFDYSVSRDLPPVEDGIFVGFAGKSRRSIERANELGYTTAVERSSVHIETQRDLLSEESKRFEPFHQPISDRRIRRETAEYELADYVITPSHFATESFLEHGFEREKVRTVSLGTSFPTTEGSERTKDDSRRGAETVRLIFCGRVGYRKGIPYLLEAWDEVSPIDAELVILSHVQEEIRDHIRPYTDRDDIRFPGWVDDVNCWYASGDAFILPSIEDGFGMTVVEAMAAGLPAIVTENVGAKNCVSDRRDGLIVPPRDSKALADAILYMCDHPERRRQMGQSAREKAREEYSITAYGDRVVDAYLSMLSHDA